MLVLGIRYLNGFVSASHGSHQQVEWPPHPARVFMALAAAHYQTGADAAEREALLWLESLPDPPEICCGEMLPRAVVTQFVPVNDKAGPSKAIVHSLPITRDRQPRTFARGWLSQDMIFLVWPDAEPSPVVRNSLMHLCSNVSRIGHSSSLVQMWLADEIPNGFSRWTPDGARATHSLRVVVAGTLSELERDFGQKNIALYAHLLSGVQDAVTTKARTAGRRILDQNFPDGPPMSRRPTISNYHGYARSEEMRESVPVTGTVFSPHLIIFTLERRDGPYRHLDLPCTLALTARWRDALISHADNVSPAARSILSGHTAQGQMIEKPHAAFLALGFVGHPNADGHLSGVALALPNDTTTEVRTELLRLTSRVSNLVLGRLGKWDLAPAMTLRPQVTLRTDTWVSDADGAQRWSTVTPVVYDQHPKAKNKVTYLEEAADMISAACTRINLPRPQSVVITQVSAHLGTPPAHVFPRLLRKDSSDRRHTHAILTFDQPVRGPILIGAGRYRGYGLFRPIEARA